MNEEHPGFGFKIERLRQRRTQRAVAIHNGIPPSVLSEWELGYRNLPAEIVTRLRRSLEPKRDEAPAGTEH